MNTLEFDYLFSEPEAVPVSSDESSLFASAIEDENPFEEGEAPAWRAEVRFCVGVGGRLVAR